MIQWRCKFTHLPRLFALPPTAVELAKPRRFWNKRLKSYEQKYCTPFRRLMRAISLRMCQKPKMGNLIHCYLSTLFVAVCLLFGGNSEQWHFRLCDGRCRNCMRSWAPTFTNSLRALRVNLIYRIQLYTRNYAINLKCNSMCDFSYSVSWVRASLLADVAQSGGIVKSIGSEACCVLQLYSF